MPLLPKLGFEPNSLSDQELNIHPLFTKDGEICLAIEAPGSRQIWRIFDIGFSPPLPNDFLLPRFPLTLALTVAPKKGAKGYPPLALAIVDPQGWQQSIPLRLTSSPA